MDKSVGRDKRCKDKHHKKLPPTKSASSSAGKSQKDANNANRTVPTSAPLIVYDDPYSGRPIESNWNSSRNLSSEGSDSEDEQLRAADFDKLLQMPISVSGHFFLSTEKHWAEDSVGGSITSSSGKSSQLYGQYFQIDTKQLNASLTTIPFYERNGYPCEIFSKQEIDSMKLKAEFECNKYDKLFERLKSSEKMADYQPKPPIKCLLGAGALPPAVDHDGPPNHPMPCLVGPMALPPELRNDPNVTGSYAASRTAITERLSAVNLTDRERHFASDTVPIESSNGQEQTAAALGSSGGEKRSEGNSTATGEIQSTAKETKEDIQNWLDDILDM